MRRLCATLLAVLVLDVPAAANALEKPDPELSDRAPSAVAAVFDNAVSTEPGRQFCSGLLVEKDWVLTAAHCVASLPHDAKLSVGMYVKGRRTLVRVKDFYFPEWFRMDSFKSGDIALLRLSRSIREAQPIDISTSSYDTPQFVFGYGKSSATYIVDKPLGARVVVRTRFATSYFGIDPVRQIAASVVAKYPNDTEFGSASYREALIEGVCDGDSGGPLLGSRASDGHRVVVGVVSFGEESCWAKTPGVYTRVSAYQHWIKDTVASH